MTAYELAAEMTDKQADNVMADWEHRKLSKLDSAKRLIKLGDSKVLAVATIILEKEKNTEMYEAAYYS